MLCTLIYGSTQLCLHANVEWKLVLYAQLVLAARDWCACSLPQPHCCRGVCSGDESTVTRGVRLFNLDAVVMGEDNNADGARLLLQHGAPPNRGAGKASLHASQPRFGLPSLLWLCPALSCRSTECRTRSRACLCSDS